MENMILEARHISKYFGSLTANDDVSLSVRRGTVHAIIGENGAGKSTLMNVISGIYKPNRGEIYVEGKQVVFRNPNDATKCGIGMVFQVIIVPALFVTFQLIQEKISPVKWKDKDVEELSSEIEQYAIKK